MTRQFDLIGIYLPDFLFRLWSIPLCSNCLHNCGFQNTYFWVRYDELWAPTSYSKFLGPQEFWRGKLIWFHKFCHRVTFRWMVRRIFYSLNVKPLLRICALIFWMRLVTKTWNRRSPFFIYPRTTRESVLKNSSSTFGQAPLSACYILPQKTELQ